MAQDLLHDLHHRGIKLRLVDGRLDVLAPPGSLTPQLRDELRSRRDDLIALLRRTGGDELPEIKPRPGERYEPFPLTDIQHAYWVGRNPAVELGGVATHFYFELAGDDLDTARLQESLRAVIARHDMLRAIVQPDGRQRVLPDVPPYDLVVNDLRGLVPAKQDAAIEQARAEMDHQVLPADRWPLFDIRASRLDDRRLRLHISLDVLIMDAASLYLVFQDWRRYYEEPDAVLPSLPVTYRDYVVAGEELRDTERYRAAERYWRDRLDDLLPPPELPLATQPSQVAEMRFTRRRTRIRREEWREIKAIAKSRGLTPSVVLMTAYSDVLRKWSKQPDFTLNLTLFNRPPMHPRIGEVVGDFTSVTMLAVHAEPEDAFVVRAQRVQQQLMRDLEHASFSGVRVLRERARRVGGGPAATMPVVFTSALVLSSEEDDSAEGMRFFGEFVHALSQTPQVWLDHQVTEELGDLYLDWDAVEALFPDGMLDDMFASYQDILARLSADPAAWDRARPLVTLPSWQAEERERVNDTASDIPARTLDSLIEERARLQPDATAAVDESGAVTYRELSGTSEKLARRLVSVGAAANTLVGVVLERSTEQVAAVLGVVRSGAAYLPIDPDWPEARRNELLAQGGAAIVVTSPRLRDDLVWPDGVEVVTLEDGDVPGARAPLPEPSPDDLAYVIFTSGSTGRPKGVAIDHRMAANTVQDINSRFDVGPADRMLAVSALSFDLSVYDIFGVLAAGGTMVCLSPRRAQDPAHWTDLVRRHGVTIWNSVPALMQAWVDASGTAAAFDGSAVRLVMLSGDWIPVGLPDAIRAAHPRASVISLGGATEGSIWSVHYPIGEVPGHWTSIPYGTPLANQRLHVYDEALEPCPVWAIGEIYLGGAGVARGYWADPERTGERFVVHPRTGERLYRTGDLGRYLPGGDIEFLGREDFQVKINGYRIELGEIASVLRRQPGVGEALVGVDTNPTTGRRQLVAHVVTAGDAEGPEAEPLSIPWHEVAEAGQVRFRRGMDEDAEQLSAYRDLGQATERLSPLIMARTLSRLGEFTAPARTATAGQIVQRCGLKPGYLALVRRWMATMAATGFLSPTGAPDEYTCDTPLDPGELDDRIRSGLGVLRVEGALRTLLEYFGNCADNQVELLRGEMSPLELLMPSGSDRVTSALYADNPVSRLQNQVAASVVRAVVDGIGGTSPVRVVEVGAGTGATTTQVLAGLPADRVRYRFTDVSTYFTERAKREFSVYPFVSCSRFDIDEPPAGQGFEPGTADVILAANVLHDAKDLDRTLGHLRSLLTPGGVLVLIESTVNSPFQAVTVGFIEGLTYHQGKHELPLLSVAEWQRHLDSSGFVGFTALPGDEVPAEDLDQRVLLAGAPGEHTGVEPGRLRAALESELPGYLVPQHYLLIDRVPLTANGKVDRNALPSPWDNVRAAEPVPPRDPVEHKVFEIWCEALERDDFGVEDDFFELGGDSLHAVRIFGRLNDELGIQQGADDGLRMLFDNPTIAGFAAVLQKVDGAVRE
ncbi:non-ribosomal peptide synthetase [Amycolatopsis saalfeldensis]|uniref:Phenyloxazoline synthase MbtB n=1 Tax=Amycolatopsis saalfeldensis TaxID=394193 RepID=A0A1H8YN05_9PSEU|nr:non-ribosomal peptide synthetase [Amycolatopsis saalfeldensis]SEP53567.1 pyochelin synthetase [Amycolatopsis saalfeldensis]